MVLVQSSPLPKIVLTSLFVCFYVFGENAVCYNSDSLYVGNCAPVRKWWNWQTHHLEGVAPKGVGVQIPPSAPIALLAEIWRMNSACPKGLNSMIALITVVHVFVCLFLITVVLLQSGKSGDIAAAFGGMG